MRLGGVWSSWASLKNHKISRGLKLFLLVNHVITQNYVVRFWVDTGQKKTHFYNLLVHVNHIDVQINHSKIQFNNLFSLAIQFNKIEIQTNFQNFLIKCAFRKSCRNRAGDRKTRAGAHQSGCWNPKRLPCRGELATTQFSGGRGNFGTSSCSPILPTGCGKFAVFAESFAPSLGWL